ncbi:DUF4911 domain-containing protein [Desulfovibrio sp. SGI.169]|uniref:DUF4911 domain-containing protein n=1 Tax=Desulfovibrio sp. SGI.169 TaxID=3420561 RepID=UPI003D07B591
MGAPRPSADTLPPALRDSRRTGSPLPPPRRSGRLLLRLAPENVALFRFLLEAYDNCAYFTVLERRPALLKLVFSPQRERAARRALAEISHSLPLRLEEWPLPGPSDISDTAARP